MGQDLEFRRGPQMLVNRKDLKFLVYIYILNLTTIQENIYVLHIYILYKQKLTVGRGSANNQVNPFMSADSCPILSPLDPIMSPSNQVYIIYLQLYLPLYPVRIMNQLCSEP